MKKIIYIIAAVLLINSHVMSQETKSGFAVGVGLSGSTNGLGGSAIASWNDVLALRLSYEALNMSFANAFTIDQNDLSFSASPAVKAGGFSAILDWYFLKSMYLSGGFVLTNLNVVATINSNKPMIIGDIEYSPNEMGEMKLALNPKNKVAPYLGLGFGRNISRDKKLAMSFEIGAYHTGSFVVDATGTELFEPNGDPANQGSINNINEALAGISWMGIYPILKLGVSYKIWKQK